MAKKLKSDEVEDGRTSVCGDCLQPIHVSVIEGYIVHTVTGIPYGQCEAAIKAKNQVLAKRRKLI